jgi:hypothetical protein
VVFGNSAIIVLFGNDFKPARHDLNPLPVYCGLGCDLRSQGGVQDCTLDGPQGAVLGRFDPNTVRPTKPYSSRGRELARELGVIGEGIDAIGSFADLHIVQRHNDIYRAEADLKR